MARVVHVVDAERALDLRDRGLRGRDGLELLVVEIVGARGLGLVFALRRLARRGHALEGLDHSSELVVRGGSRLGLAGDDQRRSRLVDQDRVDLVHDRVRVAPLHGSLERHRHVVPEVVESELGVRPIGHVVRIRDAALGERHQVLDVADRRAEELVYGARPLGVALGEVVVDRHEVDTVPGQAVQVERLHRDEGLTLSRLHLRDVALVEDDPAHQLHVEQADADRALERLSYGRVRLEDELLERLPVLEPELELRRLRAELGVGERLEVGLERADVGGLLLKPLEAPPFAHAEDTLELAERLGSHGPRVPARVSRGYSARTRISQRSPSTRWA